MRLSTKTMGKYQRLLLDRHATFSVRCLKNGAMSITNLCEFYIELAADVFKSRNPFLLKSLTDFLTGLPTTTCGVDILMQAFNQLAMTDPDACRWLLDHSAILLPEIDFEAQATGLARALLLTKGFRCGPDYRMGKRGRIILRDQLKAELLRDCSVGDRFLLEQVLVNHDGEVSDVAP